MKRGERASLLPHRAMPGAAENTERAIGATAHRLCLCIARMLQAGCEPATGELQIPSDVGAVAHGAAASRPYEGDRVVKRPRLGLSGATRVMGCQGPCAGRWVRAALMSISPVRSVKDQVDGRPLR